MSDDEKIIPGAPDRYANPCITRKTLEGLTPENIDMLGTFGRMLYDQDLHVENMLVSKLEAFEKRIMKRMDDLEKKVDDQACQFKDFKKDEFNPLKNRVEEIGREVHLIKKKNSWLVIILRGIGWVTLGSLLIRLWHGPFLK